MRLDYSPFFSAEIDGKYFFNEEDLNLYLNKKRVDWFQQKTCLERVVLGARVLIEGVYFGLLLLRARLFG